MDNDEDDSASKDSEEDIVVVLSVDTRLEHASV
jgi:hypothetical protein